MTKNQKGFGIGEGLLILVVVVLVGILGWNVYGFEHIKTPAGSSSSSLSKSALTKFNAAINTLPVLDGTILWSTDHTTNKDPVGGFFNIEPAPGEVTRTISKFLVADKPGADLLSSLQSTLEQQGWKYEDTISSTDSLRVIAFSSCVGLTSCPDASWSNGLNIVFATNFTNADTNSVTSNLPLNLGGETVSKLAEHFKSSNVPVYGYTFRAFSNY